MSTQEAPRTEEEGSQSTSRSGLEGAVISSSAGARETQQDDDVAWATAAHVRTIPDIIAKINRQDELNALHKSLSRVCSHH